MTAVAQRVHLAWVTLEDFSGHALILRGHALSAETIAKVAAEEHITRPKTVEVFWNEHPRVKWCERIDGFGCDENGDWHRHWSAVKPNANESTHFTVMWEADR
ncbi:hypothetical protein F9L07_19585 [Pimelobacter simplex]|uniref:Uncharacterized protein n=1 Tax=Nocardioides simplex TaxID=2045 RepID=A0A7J5DVG2_NOCSI|nr:hypothetical protein [Pimelobacter simplex]KAB2809245.1 hypothetical protein F9L07_19585 [Pimelobacter simplex]